ncbi:MAG: UMP kinase [Candidatus Krumholzibacteriota bacterium]|nr:UMP kinase [Candidatus Krumholzibacteriota bacterium]
MTARPEIRRVLLKVSGEVFGGVEQSIDLDMTGEFASDLKEALETGVEIAVVVGGGNILRGSMISGKKVQRISADYMGMLGTVINALALQGVLEEMGVEARVMTPFGVGQVAERFIRREAAGRLREGMLLILAGGTGNPYFTTDTAAALRAAEIEADILIKGTKVQGIYDSDPVRDPSAKLIEELSFSEVLRDDLRVMDGTAVALCRDNDIPIIVFNIMEKGNLKKVLQGEKIGSIVR